MKIMKKAIFTILIGLCLMNSFAQIAFKSGSVELDNDLNSINASAKLDIGGYRAQLKLEYNVDDKKLDYMSVKLKMQPAEIYYALEISKYSKKPIDDVLVIYQKDKSKGWGQIAKNAGIKPGSDEFHAMKSNASGKSKKGKEKHKEKDKNNNGKGNKK